MELTATVNKKFVRGDDSIKVVLDVEHGDGVLDFLDSVAGMDCEIYVKVSERAPKNESPAAVQPADGQRNMFEEKGEAPPVEDPAPDDTPQADPLEMPVQKCAHDLEISTCSICAMAPAGATS